MVSMRDRVQGNVALLADSDSPSFRAAKAEGTLGPNAGNLPHNVQSTTATTNYGAWPAPTPGGHPYPDMPQVSDAKPLLDQMGATGVAIFSGIITSEEYNPDFYWRDGVKIFDQMLRSDGQINAMRMQMEMPLQRATWSIEPASDDAIDQEIASFVESCLFDDMRYETSSGRVLTQKWGDTLRHILLSLWYGFSAMEVCWRVEDGWVKWARWLPLLPRTVWRWWVGDDNELVGIQQWTFKNYSYQFVEIPADKLLLFVHRMEGNNYEGVSLLRTAYPHWWYKTNFQKIEAIGIERNAVVPAVIKLPPNYTSNDITFAQQIVQNIRANEMGGITLPPEWDLEYPKNQQRYAMQAQPSIQYHDVMIARNVLAQFLNLGSTETGAYALADSQLDAFRASLQGIAEYVEDVINNDAIPRLVNYNYDGVVNYPKLKCSKIALQDLNRLSTLLTALQPYLPPSPELSDFLAAEIGLPVVPSSTIQTTNPGSPNTPDRPQNQNANNHETEETDSKDGTDVAETPPSEGSGSAGGGQSGGDAATSGSSGSARSGLSEPGSEAWLLREAVQAAYTMDAVERGVTYKLYGHASGYDEQSHDPKTGQWEPGQGPQEGKNSGGSGSGRGRGGAAKAKGEAKGSSARGDGSGSKSSEQPTESIHERSARLQREQGLAREVRPGQEKVENRLDVRTIDPYITGKASVEETRSAYGEHQLGAALNQNSMSVLRDAARDYGVKAGGTKAELISRITSAATGGRYSANFGGRSEEETTTSTRSGRSGTKAPASETIHERSARLQREGGLPREVRPEDEKLQLRVRDAAEGKTTPLHVIEPAHLAHIYGEEHLGAALSGVSMPALRESARQAALPNPWPRSKADLVSAITAHVTGGRYSADFGGGSRSSGGRSSGGGGRSSGTPRTAADHEARITALRSQLAQAERDYETWRQQNGQLSERLDPHAMRLLERIADLEGELAHLLTEREGDG